MGKDKLNNNEYNKFNDDNRYNQNYNDEYNQSYGEQSYYDEYNQNNPYVGDGYSEQDYYSESYQEERFEQNYYQQDNQNYNEGNYYSNSQNYSNQQGGRNYNSFVSFDERAEERPKKNRVMTLLLSLIAILLLAGGGYFGYAKFIKEEIIKVDLTQYEVQFSPYGVDGEGNAAADVKKIPNVKTEDNSIKEFLQDPAITYNKTRNLRNGDKVEVTLSLSKATAKAKKVELEGEFKRTFTVTGLSEKRNSNITSNTATRGNVFKENPSKDTKKLESVEVSQWATTTHIKYNDKNASVADFTTDVWLGRDNLVYANILKNGNVVGKYRVNGRGELEEQRSSSWYVISRVYTEF